MKRCPSCSRTYPDTVDQFCPFDGAPLLTEGSGTIYDSKAGVQPPPQAPPAQPPGHAPPMPTMMAPPPTQQPSLNAINNNPFGQPPPQQQQPGVWMPPPPPAFAGEGPMSNFVSASGGRNQMAVASFATSLFGLLCCQIASPVALVLGFMAYSQLKANPSQDGKGFATAGIIISSISLLFVVLYIILMLSGTIR